MSLTINSIIGLVVTQIIGDGEVAPEAIANFIEVAGLLVFGILAWIGRVRLGGITWYGMRK